MIEALFWLAFALLFLYVAGVFAFGLLSIWWEVLTFLLFWPWRLFADGEHGKGDHGILAVAAMALYALLVVGCFAALSRP